MRNPKSSTSREIRQKNEQFSTKARTGKNPINVSRKEKISKQSPLGLWALGLVLFVVVGGGGHLVTAPACRTYDLHPQCFSSSSDLSSSERYLSLHYRPFSAFASFLSRVLSYRSIYYHIRIGTRPSYSRHYSSGISAFIHIPSGCARTRTPGRALYPAPCTAPCPGSGGACVLDTFHVFCL